MFTGIDAALADNWRLGLLVGYANSSISSAASAASAEADSYQFGLYGGARFDALGPSFGAIYAHHVIETSRTTPLAGANEISHSTPVHAPSPGKPSDVRQPCRFCEIRDTALWLPLSLKPLHNPQNIFSDAISAPLARLLQFLRRESRREPEMIKHAVVLEDTTLRDGEQTPGSAFSKQQKLEIFSMLLRLGVKFIEPGIPAMGGDEVATLMEMLERKDEALLVGWNRGVREDIERTIDLGFAAVHIGLPTSNKHLAGCLGRDRQWLIQQATDLIKFAKDKGVFVSISAEDVGRTELPFLQEYAVAVTEAGANRLRLSDTIGIMTPEKYAARVRAVRKVSPIPTQCHCHNDFGLSIANTLAGLEAGATYFHVCINGIGERAGMPDLAQMTMALKKLYDIDLGLDTTMLTEVAHLVSTATKQPLPVWQPIVGNNVFAHESGIHAKGMLKDAETFEPLQPEEVGGTRRYVVGKHSGRSVIKHVLEAEGVHVVNAALAPCLEMVRAESVKIGGEIRSGRLKEIYKKAVHDVGPQAAA
ncbi:homocitrate synthase/isopropylmalate synthase family protein [Mesorhizobium temperatum]|uniref:Homocitrate synthase n=1 Tax=Mesorhizobium temperatum TaxID=241416 RepID=A0A271LJW8_9HYPH|nr:autotransporter domain-containing protein [Mesorhizobium temperatum]PAQ07655.1 hypothetical protein CIT26_20245 [Mesorhizobium temperatum]